MEIKVPFLKEEIGAGDVVKAATGAVGIKPCSPCEERRRRMNNALRFVPQEPRWTKPPEVPEGWARESSCQSDGKRAELFRHQDGRLIIWRVIEGEYKNSHTFCCGDQMRGMALQKWEEVCRSL